MSLRLFLFIMPSRNDYILQRHSKFKLKKEETFIKKQSRQKKNDSKNCRKTKSDHPKGQPGFAYVRV